jgi:hypothetical protein
MDLRLRQQTSFHNRTEQLQRISELSLFRQASVSKRVSPKKGGEHMTKPYKGGGKENPNAVLQWTNGSNGSVYQQMVMPISELQQIYEYVDRKTQGFTQFPLEILQEEPRSLRILLGAIHMGYKEFAERVRLPRWKIQYFCYGFHHPNPTMASKLLQTIETLFRRNNLIGNVTFPFVLNAFTTVISRMNRNNRQWPPIRNMTTTQFQTMLQVVKQWKGFELFPPILLIRHAQTLLTYRVALNAPRPVFARIFSEDTEVIEKRENGEMPIRFYRTAEHYMDALEEIFNQLELNRGIDEQQLLANFERVKGTVWYADEWRSNLAKATQASHCSPSSLNPAELQVIDVLEENGVKCYFPNELKPQGLCCMIHGTLWDGNRNRHMDFVIPDNQKPRAIIECRQVKLKRDEGFVREINDIFDSLRHQYPLSKLIVVLLGKQEPLVTPPRYLKNYDAVFIDTTLHALPEYIRMMLSKE